MVAPFGRKGWTSTWSARTDRQSDGRDPGCRQGDNEPGTALGAVGDHDAAAVPINDPLGDRETQPGPAAGRSWGAIEPLEDVRHVLGADARTVILDHEGRACPVGSHRDSDPPVGRAVADRVV